MTASESQKENDKDAKRGKLGAMGEGLSRINSEPPKWLIMATCLGIFLLGHFFKAIM